MNVHTFHNVNMKLQTAPRYALNVKCSISLIQCNFDQSNRFDPLVNHMTKASSEPGINKSTSLKGLKFVSLNINGIRGKKLELVAFLDCHKPDTVAIQETKIDDSISTSELFPDSCPYNAYGKTGTFMVSV